MRLRVGHNLMMRYQGRDSNALPAPSWLTIGEQLSMPARCDVGPEKESSPASFPFLSNCILPVSSTFIVFCSQEAGYSSVCDLL